MNMIFRDCLWSLFSKLYYFRAGKLIMWFIILISHCSERIRIYYDFEYGLKFIPSKN